MGLRGAKLGFLFIFLLAGAASAVITNVTTISSAAQARWTQTSATAFATTQGGNITNTNLTGAVQLTTKWADFYGNISTSTIQLRDAGGTAVYTWAYSAAAGKGEICLSTASTFPPGTLASANLTDLNTQWQLGTIDNATGTFNTTFNGLNISASVISPVGAAIQGSSTFTCAAVYNGTLGAKGGYAYCTNISNAGKNYLNANYNYEVLVPTTPSATETYYFYIELIS